MKDRLLVIALALGVTTAHADEIGHYVPGLPNIRDLVVPTPGVYGTVYNYWYSTDRLNDSTGAERGSITLGPGDRFTVEANLDVELYALSPMLIWVTPWHVAGARLAAFVAPSFATSSVGASLATTSGRGATGDETIRFGVGDLFVQPLWLGWSARHVDAAFAYAFYAPVGRYDTEQVTLPVVGEITAEAIDNIGLGFWTHQLQGAVSWYPWADRRMAVASAVTYELHGEKEGFDLTPGQNVTINWGVSQFLPLGGKSLLLEIGATGYSGWQLTDDAGSDARHPDVRDEVHAVGGQAGIIYTPWLLQINSHYFYELSSQDRFQGQSFGVSVAKKL